MEFGLIGLGKIGGNLARQALEKNIKVVGYRRTGVSDEMRDLGVIAAESLQNFGDLLPQPRIIFIYIPSGKAVDSTIEELLPCLDTDDVLVDGGNSYWGDSIRRHEYLHQKGIHYIDLGTSGGVEGARRGACFMAGGDKKAVALIEPIIRELAIPNGYVHAGPSGAGHFVKLVHNGIEFGMLQAIAEGIDLLEHSSYSLDIPEVLKCWNHGSVIRSWLVELMEAAFREEGDIQQIPPYVEDTGEVNWLVQDALEMEVAVPVIALAVMQLFASRDRNQYWARAIAMMRHGFGEHPYGEEESLAKKRHKGRISGFPRPDGEESSS